MTPHVAFALVLLIGAPFCAGLGLLHDRWVHADRGTRRAERAVDLDPQLAAIGRGIERRKPR